MFDKKMFVSIGLAFLIALSAAGSVCNIKQTFQSYQSSSKDYISATTSHQSHDYTTIKSGDFLQSVYSNVKLDIDTYVAINSPYVSVLKRLVSSSAIFYTLHHIKTAISKMLFPFHTFW